MSQTKVQLINNVSGNSGFGTATPSTNLHVKGPDGSAPKITLSEGTSESAIRSTASGTSSDVRLMTSVSGSQTTKLIVDYTGKVGVGTTSPAETMHVNGGDVLISHTAAPNVRIVSADNSSGSATNRVFLGIATGSNNFMNGSGANDTCLVCSEGGNFLLSNGTSYRFQISTTGKMFSPATYTNTTSNSANMSVPNSDGQFYRSTSSIKYKDNVVTLTDTLADKILNCRPVSYTSKCSNDDKTKVFYGLIAEEVDKIDQSLVFYNNDSETPEPEGVQYDRFVPALINLVKRQKTQIETLETKVSALEAA